LYLVKQTVLEGRLEVNQLSEFLENNTERMHDYSLSTCHFY